MVESHDALVIGGGFYGVAVASYLAERRGLKRVAVIDREGDLLRRASYSNQARVHNGYHYPRSFTTAYRSRVNLPRFVSDYPQAVRSDFTKVYAIARVNSKVTAGQFVRFCREIGASLTPASAEIVGLFEPRLIEGVFLVNEFAFDARVLRDRAWADLKRLGIETVLETRVQGIYRDGAALRLACTGPGGEREFGARHVFNCTYSGLNGFGGDFPGTRARLKHEITELALVRPPAALANLGVTVMDGAYFSAMPFPAKSLHSLSHVRYTPHRPLVDARGADPYASLAAEAPQTRVDRMIRDAARYLPSLRDARYAESLFEVKTVLVKNESDDGRPILFESHRELGSCHSILGGKIDNIYDVLERLEELEIA